MVSVPDKFFNPDCLLVLNRYHANERLFPCPGKTLLSDPVNPDLMNLGSDYQPNQTLTINLHPNLHFNY